VRAWAALWFLAVFFGLPRAVQGHDPGLSTATLRLETDKLEAVLVFSVVDVGELVDLHRTLCPCMNIVAFRVQVQP